MDMESVRQWVVLFLGVLCAILIADAASGSVVILAGVKGVAAFILNFVLYAAIFFAALFVLKKYGHIDIFSFGRK